MLSLPNDGRYPTLEIDPTAAPSAKTLQALSGSHAPRLVPVLIGGPTGVVVEANIVRAAPATREAPLPENGNGSWPLRPEPMWPPRPAPRCLEPDEQVNWPLPQHGEAPPRPARETRRTARRRAA
jgi:hypothetical protein